MAPKVEAPKVEAPKVEAPKVEAPKFTLAPKVMAPIEKTKKMVEKVIVGVGIFSLVVHLSMLIVGALYKDECELKVR